jgi:hypothetical protein
MAENEVRFGDGAAYERMMGTWGRLVGEIFLDWLALPSGLRCLGVGCGNGAFTELLIERSAADMAARICDVRFIPEGRYSVLRSACPLRANSRHWCITIQRRFWCELNQTEQLN